jgi:hypothetical protein
MRQFLLATVLSRTARCLLMLHSLHATCRRGDRSSQAELHPVIEGLEPAKPGSESSTPS